MENNNNSNSQNDNDIIINNRKYFKIQYNVKPNYSRTQTDSTGF